jgi:uncharacterized membrane protein required for colicin V production
MVNLYKFQIQRIFICKNTLKNKYKIILGTSLNYFYIQFLGLTVHCLEGVYILNLEYNIYLFFYDKNIIRIY